MNGEEYGIKITMLLTQAKNAIKNMVTTTKIAGKQMQDNMTVKPNDPNEFTRKLFADYDNWGKETKNVVNDVTENIEKVNNTANKTGMSLGDMFTKAEKKGRRFILSLFSIRSIWSLISRSASSYISTNDALNQKIQLTSQIMGQMLAPVIKKVIDLAQYAIIIIAKVIQLFTGYNALANITTKSLNGTAKASKNLSKSLASFDTISNLGDQSSGLSGDIGASVDALDEFQRKVDRITEIFEKYKGLITFISTAVGLIFGLSTLAKIKAVLGVAGSGATAVGASGLLGVLSVVALLAVASIVIPMAIDSAKKTIKEMKETKKAIDATTSGIDEQVDSSIKLTDKMKKLANQTDKNSEENKTYNNLLKNQIEEYSNLSKSYDGQQTWLIKLGAMLGITKDQYNNLTEAERKTMDAVVDGTIKMGEQYKQHKLNSDMLDTYKNGLQESIKYLESSVVWLGKDSAEYQENKIKIQELKAQLDKLNGYTGTAEVKVKADTSDFKTKMKKIFSSSAKTALKAILGISFPGFSSWINSFDVGTNYVPNDQLAMIHKGEMVVPKKYNPATSGIGTGNDETNRLLNRLIVTLENKDMNAYISSNDVGRASVNYINQQSRIMGRKLI